MEKLTPLEIPDSIMKSRADHPEWRPVNLVDCIKVYAPAFQVIAVPIAFIVFVGLMIAATN